MRFPQESVHVLRSLKIFKLAFRGEYPEETPVERRDDGTFFDFLAQLAFQFIEFAEHDSKIKHGLLEIIVRGVEVDGLLAELASFCKFSQRQHPECLRVERPGIRRVLHRRSPEIICGRLQIRLDPPAQIESRRVVRKLFDEFVVMRHQFVKAVEFLHDALQTAVPLDFHRNAGGSGFQEIVQPPFLVVLHRQGGIRVEKILVRRVELQVSLTERQRGRRRQLIRNKMDSRMWLTQQCIHPCSRSSSSRNLDRLRKRFQRQINVRVENVSLTDVEIMSHLLMNVLLAVERHFLNDHSDKPWVEDKNRVLKKTCRKICRHGEAAFARDRCWLGQRPGVSALAQ